MNGIEAREFRNFIKGNGLVDLNFIGLDFTWYNDDQGGAKVWEKIDGVLARTDWIQMYRDTRFIIYQEWPRIIGRF